jgi:chromosome segregation ATPase
MAQVHPSGSAMYEHMKRLTESERDWYVEGWATQLHGYGRKEAADLAAENARIRLQREKAEDERDRLQARLDTATAHVAELRGQRDQLRYQRDASHAIRHNQRDQIDAMRAVVEAAEAWRSMRADTPTKPKPESAALIAAVDAWRAAQPDQEAPETALSASASGKPTAGREK